MNYEDSTAENNTMVNVGNGVDISSVSSNTHLTPGYDDGPDMLKNRNLRVAGNYISLARTTSIGGIAWICSGIKVSGYNMKKDGAVLPKKIYPVKGVTVEDNQISGYGNGISMSLTDTDTVTDNQVTMKKTFFIFQFWDLCPGFQRKRYQQEYSVRNCKYGEFISPVLSMQQDQNREIL